MNPDIHGGLETLETLIGQPGEAQPHPQERLFAGVDLGTANLALVVINEAGRPVGGALREARVARDGLVVDFIGAVDLLREMKAEVEDRLGAPLTAAASGYPPGVAPAEMRATANVLQAAGLECTGLVDEPTAANYVLGLQDGAIIDVGGGTTGIAVVQAGQVVFTADEPTGGTHFSLTVAGALNLAFEDAEILKRRPSEQPRLFPIVRPVMEKVAAITRRHIAAHPVSQGILVGGAGQFIQMDTVLAQWLGFPVQVSPHAMLVTPLGIALHHAALERST